MIYRSHLTPLVGLADLKTLGPAIYHAVKDRYQEAADLYRSDIFAVAEAKLGREVSADERAGVEHLSLMMLEAVYRSFASDGYTADKVESDLRFFASQPRTSPPA